MKKIMTKEQEIVKYFRTNIFEAFCAYNAWKMLSYSRSNSVVSDEMARRYTEIQNYHTSFFIIAEKSFLLSFVVLILHAFDRRSDSYSLYKVDKEKTQEFVNSNNSTLKNLTKLRHELFAHRNTKANTETYSVPSIECLDNFFEQLITLYNNITPTIDNSTTQFIRAKEVKNDIESLFQNLYRGELIRKTEIDIEWMWEKDINKASKKV